MRTTREIGYLCGYLQKQAAGPGGGRGRMGGPLAAGPGGECVCPKCGNKMSHATGQPCSEIACSECGTKMTRTAD